MTEVFGIINYETVNFKLVTSEVLKKNYHY